MPLPNSMGMIGRVACLKCAKTALLDHQEAVWVVAALAAALEALLAAEAELAGEGLEAAVEAIQEEVDMVDLLVAVSKVVLPLLQRQILLPTLLLLEENGTS